MTKFLGWFAPNGARVIRCNASSTFNNDWSVDFDRMPCDDGGSMTGRVFDNDGNHRYEVVGKLIPPGTGVDWTKPCQLVAGGKPVTILTTGAAGDKPVIFQVAGEADLQRDYIFGQLVQNVPTEIVVMVKLIVSTDMQTIKSIEVVK